MSTASRVSSAQRATRSASLKTKTAAAVASCTTEDHHRHQRNIIAKETKTSEASIREDNSAGQYSESLSRRDL